MMKLDGPSGDSYAKDQPAAARDDQRRLGGVRDFCSGVPKVRAAGQARCAIRGDRQ